MSQVNLHIFRMVHRHVQVEISDVHAHELCIVSRDNTVPYKFSRSNVSCAGCNVARIIDQVASDSESSAFWFCFLWSIITDKMLIGNSSVFRDIVHGNKFYRVGSSDSSTYSLCQSSKLVSSQSHPHCFGCWICNELLV